MLFPRSVSAQQAAAVLRRIFGGIPGGLAFRLWDGTLVPLGTGVPACTVILHRPATFVRLVRDPSPMTFAEAYVESAIDIEGDLYAGMVIANAIETIRLSVTERLRILLMLWRR